MVILRRVSLLCLLFAGMSLCSAPALASLSDGVPTKNLVAHGDITLAGNTLVTCPYSTTCAAARDSAAIPPLTGSYLSRFNNNYYTMKEIDKDSSTATTNSTSSTLKLPQGAKVLWAGLYWGATPPAGADPTSSSEQAKAKAIKIKPPGIGSSYRSITASKWNYGIGYSCFADVSSLVKEYGAGQYMVGGAYIRKNDQGVGAGWTLLVMYEHQSRPLQRLMVYDGMVKVTASSSPVSLPSLGGFKTPAAGTVQAKVGFIAFEGDRGSLGDSVKLNGNALGDAQAPASPTANFFNSGISILGSTSEVPRVPFYKNQLGWDSKIVNADGKLANNATTATVTMQPRPTGQTSSGDGFQLNALSFATNLYAANMQNTHTPQDLNGGEIRIGDRLRYTVVLKNIGENQASNAVFSLPAIPANTKYSPGSMKYNGESLTDGLDSDRGELSGGKPLIRVGTLPGGLVPVSPTATYTIVYDLEVTSLPANGSKITSSPRLAYDGSSIATGVVDSIQDAVLVVRRPDLAISGSVSSPQFGNGQPAEYSFVVKNVGSSSSENSAQVTNQLPVGLNNSPRVSGQGWSCLPIVDGLVSCSRSDALEPGKAYPTLVVSIGSITSPALTPITNTANLLNAGDSNGANNQAQVTRIVGTGSSAWSAEIAPSPESLNNGKVPTDEEVLVEARFKNISANPATGVKLRIDSDLENPQLDLSRFTLTASKGSMLSQNCQILGDDGEPPVLDCAGSTVQADETILLKAYYIIDSGADAQTVKLTSTAQSSNMVGSAIKANALLNIAAADTSTNLSIAGMVDPDPLIGGQGALYAWTVSNDGDYPSSGKVEVQNQIPIGLRDKAVVRGDGWSCDPITNGLARCWRSDVLEAGDSYPDIEIQVDSVDAPAGSQVDSTANLANEGDNDPSDNSETLASTVEAQPDSSTNLSIEGAVDPDPPVQGQAASYTWTVSNQGEDNPSSGEVLVVNQLPLDLRSGAAVSGAGWTCDPIAAGLVKCKRSDPLDPGETYPDITVSVPAVAAAGGEVLTNSAVLSNAQDNDSSDNEAAVTSTVEAPPATGTNLSLEGAVDPDPPVQGGRVEYSWTVTNAGDENPSEGEVLVVNQLPSELRAGATVQGDGWSCDPIVAGLVKCKRSDPLDPGETYPDITVSVPAVAAAGGDTLLNSATLANSKDLDGEDNTATLSSTVEAAPATGTNLAIRGEVDPDPPVADEEALYTWTVSNEGEENPSEGEVLVVNQLPSDLQAGAAAQGEGWICDPIISGLVKCKRSDPLDPGDEYPGIVVTVPSVGAQQGDKLENTATLENTKDTFEDDNLATVSSTVQAGEDNQENINLSIDGIVDPDPIVRGEEASYIWTVSNSGDNTSSGEVLVTNQLPAGLQTEATVQGEGWECDPVAAGLIKCKRSDSLESGEDYPEITVTIPEVEAPVGSTITNTATLANSADNDPSDNTSSMTGTVQAGEEEDPDLSLQGEISSENFAANQAAQYTWTISNSGTATSTGKTQFQNQLPLGLKDGAVAQGEGWNCDPVQAGLVKCSREDDLEADETYPEITVDIPQVKLTPGSTVVNSASISNSSDPFASNNTAAVSRQVGSSNLASTDLALEGNLSSPSFINRLPVQYTWTVSNRGTQPSSGKVEFQSRLPEGLRDNVTIQASGWTCENPSTNPGSDKWGLVRCWRSNVLPAGQSYPNIVVGVRSLRQPARSQITTQAGISNAADINTANNQAQVTRTVGPGSSTILSQISADRSSVAAGEELRITSLFKNTGTSDADKLTLKIDSNLDGSQLQATGFDLSSSQGSVQEEDCTLIQDEDVKPHVECQTPYMLAGETVTVEVYYRPAADLPNTTLQLTASSNADNFTQGPANDSAQIQVQLSAIKPPPDPYVDLQTTQSISQPTVLLGQTLQITSRVTNNGSAASGPIKLYSVLPDGLQPSKAQWRSESGATGTCVSRSGVVSCSGLPSLSSSSTNKYIHLTVEAKAGKDLSGPQFSSSSAVGTATDINPYNNSSSAGFMASPWARAALSHKSPQRIPRGGIGVFELTALNIGPSSVSGAFISIRLFRGASLARKIPGCSQTKDLVRCSLGDLSLNSQKILSIPLKANSAVPVGEYTMARANLGAGSPISVQSRANLLRSNVE